MSWFRCCFTDRGFVLGGAVSRKVPLLFATEAAAGFHELVLLFLAHLGKVDIYGIRVSFLFLVFGIPLGFVFSCRTFLSKVAQGAAHGPS